MNQYKIYYINPQVGQVDVAIIVGKNEAMKRYRQIKNKRPETIFFIQKV